MCTLVGKWPENLDKMAKFWAEKFRKILSRQSEFRLLSCNRIVVAFYVEALSLSLPCFLS